jgi:ubiquinone/menaquinone biosynthesis C-methylase UbiE
LKSLPDIRIPADMPVTEMPDLLRHWYLGPPARRHMMLRRFAEVDAELPASGAVLDVGSAWGFNVMALSRMGYSAVGMDLVPDQFVAGAAIARENAVPFEVLGANACALPFEDASFDAITMVETFEHIYIDDRPAALAECHRVLRPGGTLVLSTPNYGSFVERAKRFTGNHRWIRERLPTMCYPEEGMNRDEYHPYRYHHPLPDGGLASIATSTSCSCSRTPRAGPSPSSKSPRRWGSGSRGSAAWLRPSASLPAGSADPTPRDSINLL